MTREEASALAFVRAFGRRDFDKVWQGWMRYSKHADEPVIATPDDMARPNDPLNVRLARLKQTPRLYRVASFFTVVRSGAHVPTAVVGSAPDDPPGQCALLYRLRGHPLIELANAFSVGLNEFGERLLIGERLHSTHCAVDEFARRAVEAG